MTAEQSFYWFDYETFGTHPAWDRPCQFAGVRTDTDLNVIGEPLVIYCKQAIDYLPHPTACQVTGITPQLANEKGLVEAEFIQRIVKELGKSGTCSVGYNSIRFDDEFTRHTLFRNLYDPYEQEWKDGNSRWDLLDVVRLTRALRPEGINWPKNDDGSASNRLEHLSAANAIEHAQAHDAMSDVWATIGMARLIKTAQPRLFAYAFSQRTKQRAGELLNTRDRQPCLQVSGMIPGNRHHIAPVLPLARLPDNPNSVIILELSEDPHYLSELSADELARRLFQPAESRKVDDPPRPLLRTVQLNKCPVLVPMNVLRQSDANRLGIDQHALEANLDTANRVLTEPVLNMIMSAMTRHWPEERVDVDGSLYTGAFLSQADRQKLRIIHGCDPQDIASHGGFFDDTRLDEMIWRYQARNYPESLSPEQRLLWLEQCAERLLDESSPWLGFQAFDAAMDSNDWSDNEASLRESLQRYKKSLEQLLLIDNVTS